MGWDGVGQLAEVEGRMNADQLVNILETHLLSNMEECGIPTMNLIFQQDNNTKNTQRGQNLDEGSCYHSSELASTISRPQL